MQRGFDNPSYLRRVVRSVASPAHSNLPNAADSLFTNPVTPESDGAPLHRKLLGDELIGLPLGRTENNPRSKHHLLRG